MGELQLRPPSLQPRALAAPAPPNQPLPSRRHLRLALQLTTQRASARLMGLHLRPLPLLPNALAVPRLPSRLHQTTVLPFRRIDYLRAAGRLQMRSVRSARAGTTPGGRATLTCATAVVTRCPPPSCPCPCSSAGQPRAGAELKLPGTFQYLLRNQSVRKRIVLQPVGVLWINSWILWRLLPGGKLLGLEKRIKSSRIIEQSVALAKLNRTK